MAESRWNPEVFKAWQRIIRDTVITILGTFMLVWQTVFVLTPQPLLVGAGLFLLGVPPALRLDDLIRKRKDEE